MNWLPQQGRWQARRNMEEEEEEGEKVACVWCGAGMTDRNDAQRRHSDV
jgi:hypothetical protein